MLHTEKIARIVNFMEELSRECWHWAESGMDDHPNVTVIPLIECWKALGELTGNGSGEELLEEAKTHYEAGKRAQVYLEGVHNFPDHLCVKVAERAREFDILVSSFAETKTREGWDLKPSQADHDARTLHYQKTAEKLRELVSIASDGAQFALPPLPEPKVSTGKIIPIDERTHDKIVNKIADFVWDARVTIKGFKGVYDSLYSDVLTAIIRRKKRAVKTLLHTFGLCLKKVPDFGPGMIDLNILFQAESESEAREKVVALLESWDIQPEAFQPEIAVHMYAAQKLFTARAVYEEWCQKIITTSTPSLHDIAQEFTAEFDMVLYIANQFQKLPQAKKQHHAGDWFNTEWYYKAIREEEFEFTQMAHLAEIYLFR